MTNKRWGQNFLINKNKTLQIIESLPNLTKRAIFLEIGPGKGALTKFLLEKVDFVIAIEIDEKLVLKLEKEINDSNFLLIKDDALNIDLGLFLKKYQTINFVSNLPYYTAVPILFWALKSQKIETFSFMLQKELADKIKADSGNKNYGRISVALNSFLRIEKSIFVSRKCFSPIPKVDSEFLVFKRKKDLLIKESEMENYLLFIKMAFAYKRKYLLNSLKLSEFKNYLAVEKYFQKYHLSKKLRAEQLSIDDYQKIWREINF